MSWRCSQHRGPRGGQQDGSPHPSAGSPHPPLPPHGLCSALLQPCHGKDIILGPPPAKIKVDTYISYHSTGSPCCTHSNCPPATHHQFSAWATWLLSLLHTQLHSPPGHWGRSNLCVCWGEGQWQSGRSLQAAYELFRGHILFHSNKCR